jgi:hypothetical protein
MVNWEDVLNNNTNILFKFFETEFELLFILYLKNFYYNTPYGFKNILDYFFKYLRSFSSYRGTSKKILHLKFHSLYFT